MKKKHEEIILIIILLPMLFTGIIIETIKSIITGDEIGKR